MRTIDEIEERARDGYGADPDETLMLIAKLWKFLMPDDKPQESEESSDG